MLRRTVLRDASTGLGSIPASEQAEPYASSARWISIFSGAFRGARSPLESDGFMIEFDTMDTPAEQAPDYPAPALWSGCLLGVIDVDGYTFNDVPRDLAAPPVVEAGGARVGVAGQVLDVFQGRVVLHKSS